MNKHTGFTLVELMITLTVVVILLSVAVPSFRALQANNQAVTQVNLLVSTLNFARSEAVSRNATVAICPKATASIADTTCGDNGDWANGWQVFTDETGTAGAFDGTDTALRHFDPLPGSPTVTTTSNNIRYQGDGMKTPAGVITLALSQADTTVSTDRCIRISTMGQVSVHEITDTATCP